MRAVSYKNDSQGVQLNYSVAGNILSNLRNNDYRNGEEDKMIRKCLRSITDYLGDE